MCVSCAVHPSKASPGLVNSLARLGITPIITGQVIRAVYQGPDVKLGEAIVALYERETDHEITVFYGKGEKAEPEKETVRQTKRGKKHKKNR